MSFFKIVTYSNLFHFILSEAELLLDDANYLLLSFIHELSVILLKSGAYKGKFCYWFQTMLLILKMQSQ